MTDEEEDVTYDTGINPTNVRPTGEYRAPKRGELYISTSNGNVVYVGHGGHVEGESRIIVQVSPPSVYKATFGELSAELMRRFEDKGLPYDQEAGAQGQPTVEFHVDQRGEAYAILIEEDEQRMTEEDAREAALVILTQIALNEGLHRMDRIEAARTILNAPGWEL